MMRKPFLDYVFEKMSSRKLIVFILASVFVGLKMINSADWVNIAMVYIGSQAAIDMMVMLKYGRAGIPTSTNSLLTPSNTPTSQPTTSSGIGNLLSDVVTPPDVKVEKGTSTPSFISANKESSPVISSLGGFFKK